MRCVDQPVAAFPVEAAGGGEGGPDHPEVQLGHGYLRSLGPSPAGLVPAPTPPTTPPTRPLFLVVGPPAGVRADRGDVSMAL